MGIAAQIIAARLAMATLDADKTARIQGAKGSYAFEYSSLRELLRVAQPALATQGVLMTQYTGSEANDPATVWVTTRLVNEQGEAITTERLHLRTDGTAKGVAGAVTSLRRIQLYAMLGFPPDGEGDDEVHPDSTVPPPATAKQSTPPPLATPEKNEWKKQEPLRKASTLKREVSVGLSKAMRNADDELNAEPMPVEPSEGKSMSMYAYLCAKIDELCKNKWAHGLVLSYLLGRVVTKDTPPAYGCRFLLDEWDQWQQQVVDAWDYAREEALVF